MVAREQLLKAIEQVESGGRRDAVSPKGARGRMQVMPATARQPGYRVKPARDESEEEYTRVGKDYAMALLKNYGGDLEATLVAYNYGPGNANKWIASGRNKNDLPKETRDYITKVSKELGGKKMATKKQLTDQRKALQRKVRSGSATDADKRKLKRIQIELSSKGKTTAKAKAPAPKVKRRNTSLQREAASRKAEAGRRAALQQLMEDSLLLDEDVAGRRPPTQPVDNSAMMFDASNRRVPNIRRTVEKVRPTPAERGMNNMLYNIDEDIAGRRPFAPAPQEQRPVRRRAASDFERTPQRGGRLVGSPPLQPRADDIALPFNRTTGYRGIVPGGGPVTGNRGTMRPPNVNPDPQSSRDIDEDYAGRRGLSSLELMSNAPQADGFIGDEPGSPVAPYRSSGGRGDMAAQNKGYETLREYFIEDMTPRKSKVMTPFGIIDIDSTEDAYGSGDEITDMQIEMGQKKGGRLKKKKKPATRKKVAAKKKKVAVKKKPVVRKKAVAKKPPMRKKTVAKKPAGRKRAAKRGFGAELRGN